MNQIPQLIYLAFGADTYQREAVFSIVSALTRALPQIDARPFGIQVFTDNPCFYEKLPVVTQPIDPTWNGPHCYHFRIKHAALQKVLREHEKAILIDTDTFFREDPNTLFQRVTPGRLLCNAIGDHLGESPELPKEALAYLRQHNFADPHLRQTNSGVIGMVSADRALLERSIGLMDDLRPLAPTLYTLEELSLALAAHGNMQLTSCTDVIHHYWSRKAQFRAKIEAWFNKHHDAPLSQEAMSDALMVNDRLPRPPQPYRFWQKILTTLTKKERRQFFREALYGCHEYKNEFDRACSPAWWDKALENIEERRGKPIPAHELRTWLEEPLLKLLAGKHYTAMHTHLLSHLIHH